MTPIMSTGAQCHGSISVDVAQSLGTSDDWDGSLKLLCVAFTDSWDRKVRNRCSFHWNWKSDILSWKKLLCVTLTYNFLMHIDILFMCYLYAWSLVFAALLWTVWFTSWKTAPQRLTVWAGVCLLNLPSLLWNQKTGKRPAWKLIFIIVSFLVLVFVLFYIFICCKQYIKGVWTHCLWL